MNQDYQIQVNTLISATPEQAELLKERITKAVELALIGCEFLDGIYIAITEDK